LTKPIDTSALVGYGPHDPKPLHELSFWSENTMSPTPRPGSACVFMSSKIESSAATAAVHLFWVAGLPVPSQSMLPEPSRTKSMYTGCRVAAAVAVAHPASLRSPGG